MFPVVAVLVALLSFVEAGLEEIDHVIFIMQENRAFDHYYGTLAGVRGFLDPNAQVNADTGKSVFYQQVNSSLSDASDWILPYYINQEGGKFVNGSQCMEAGSNSFGNNIAALAEGRNDQWVLANSPYSIGYYKREDIPTHFAITEGWTTADMYQEGVISSTWPNRILWQTGSINIPGGKVNSTQGPVLDNNNTPGCVQLRITEPDGNSYKSLYNVSCYPYDWKTIPEYLEEVGMTWRSYQAYDNFGTDVMPAFIQMQELADNDPYNQLAQRAMRMAAGDTALGGLEEFKVDAAAGKLPQFSYIFGPAELSEHVPYSPRDGAWWQRELIEAVQNSPNYARTVMMISYDETGGWADHVVPFHSPEGTPGEWLVNPFTNKMSPIGPGFRLPFNVISPWTRGGNVYTEAVDHTSQIMFLEEWSTAKGMPWYSTELNQWRRDHMGNLVNMFDFENPDYSKVHLPAPEAPHRDPLTSLLDGSDWCEALYKGSIQPTVPYGTQDLTQLPVVEAGFKPLRGGLTEGRYLVLETCHRAVSISNSSLISSSTKSKKHLDAAQRFVVHATDPLQVDGKTFWMSSASKNGTDVYVNAELGLGSKSDAVVWEVLYDDGYTFKDNSTGEYLHISENLVKFSKTATSIKLYSVTF